MKVNMELNASELSVEDLRAFIQAIREWELRTARSKVAAIFLKTDPVMSVAEVKRVLEGIYKCDDQAILFPKPEPNLLELGKRGVVVEGELVGYCDALTLSVEEASAEELKKLQDARVIALTKIGGEGG